jgi:hypothetical protein
MASIFRYVAGYLGAVIVAYALASFFHTQMVLSVFADVGGVPLPVRLQTTAGDFLGLWQYAAVIAIALAAGFVVAAILKLVLKPLAGVAYPIAGAAGVALALTLMSMQFYGTTPIAGARGTLGFLLQCFAGAAGGFVFAALTRRRT